MRVKEPLIGRQKRQSVDNGGRGEKPIGRILMGKIDAPTHQCDGMCESGFPKWDRVQQALNPSGGIRLELNTFFLCQEMHFPQRDGRQPEFVVQIFQLGSRLRRKMIRFKHAPEKDVGIEQELHA